MRSEETHRGRALLILREKVRWLEGYPLPDDRWQAVPVAGPPIVVDAARISSTVRGLKSALRDDDRQLERRFGDPKAYAARVDRMLAHVRARPRQIWDDASLHARADARKAAGLVAAHPALAPLLDALSWIHAMRREAGTALARVAKYAAALERLDMAGRLLLLEIEDAGPLCAILAEPRAHEVSLAEPERAPLAPEMIALATALAKAEPAVQRRAMTLLARIDVDRWITTWETWRAARDDARRRESRAIARDKVKGDHADTKVLRKAKNKIEANPPFALTPSLVREALVAASSWEDRAVRALAELFAAVPGVAPERMLVHSVGVAFREERSRLVELWRALTAALPSCPRLAQEWASLQNRHIKASRSGMWFESNALGCLPARIPMKDLVSVWCVLANVEASIDRTPAQLLAIDPSIERATVRALALENKSDVHASADVMATAGALAKDDTAMFADIAERLAKVEGRWNFLPLVQAASSARSLEHVRAEILGGRIERVLRWAALAAILGKLPPPVARVTKDRAWMEHFPAPLRPAIERLAAHHRRPRAFAKQVLGRVVRPAAAIDREIAALRAHPQVASAPVAARLAALEERRDRPRPPTAQQIEKVARDLERASLRAELDAWEGQLEGAAGAKAARTLGLEVTPSWWSEPDALRIYAAVEKLPAESRKLGRELLRARHGPRPWDLHAHPTNARFLRDLAARGLDPAPWIEPSEQRFETPRGPLTLRLEDDPLEILRMGERFKTCLAIDAFNFFAAVVTAADANKRVLYARTENGVVVGRCLLAITRERHLLTFHPYAHEPAYELPRQVGAYAVELARRMGTRVSGRGVVPPLLSSQWYDDGPRDLTGAFGPLADGSSLRQALLTVEPARSAALIAAALPLDALTLPLIVALPELASRPALILALIPALEACVDLSAAAALTAADLALKAGAVEAAVGLVSSPEIPPLLRVPCPECRGNCYPEMTDQRLAIIAQCRPTLLLRVIKGADGRKGLYDAAAVALDRLHRPAQAARMRERAAQM